MEKKEIREHELEIFHLQRKISRMKMQIRLAALVTALIIVGLITLIFV